MFDITLRPLKDNYIDPLCAVIPRQISPLQLTFAAFICGVGSCGAAASGSTFWAVWLWMLNRLLDCLDGAVARQRGESSDLGGFLDLLSDFIIYSAIPICCAIGLLDVHGSGGIRRWLAVAIVEATFHINNFVLFYVAGVAEKRKAAAATSGPSKEDKAAKCNVEELTSLIMRPALVEGAESGLVFTIMLAFPARTEILCWLLAGGVIVGITQRVLWLRSVL